MCWLCDVGGDSLAVSPKFFLLLFLLDHGNCLLPAGALVGQGAVVLCAVYAFFDSGLAFEPFVVSGAAFRANGVVAWFWAIVGEMTFYRITPHASVYWRIVLFLDAVMRDPHVEQFYTLLFAFLSWGSLCESDFNDWLTCEFLDTFDTVFSEVIRPIDFIPYFLPGVVFDVIVHAEA